MTNSRSLNRNAQAQRSFAFQRPPAQRLPVPARTQHKKGRIRGGLKRLFKFTIFAGVIGFGAAYVTGYADPLVESTWEKALNASVSAGFALKTIKVEGNIRTQEGAVIEVLQLAYGDPLFGMDMSALKANVEALPWVGNAMISREMPSTIKVMVSEREPFARWQMDGKIMLVDETGTVIPGASVQNFDDLPFVVGEGAPEAASTLLNLVATTPDLADRIVAAVRIGHRRWDLEFDNGMRLKLPEPSKTYGEAQAWEAFVKLTREKDIFSLDVAVADLRLPDRIVMRLTPEGREEFEREDQET